MLLHGKKAKTMDILETIEACNLKLGRCRHFMKSIEVCE